MHDEPVLRHGLTCRRRADLRRSGSTFYINKWSALGFEYRFLPFSWNTGGFDTAGGGKDGKFPDNKISSADRQFNMNQILTLSYNIYLPFQYRVSE